MIWGLACAKNRESDPEIRICCSSAFCVGRIGQRDDTIEKPAHALHIMATCADGQATAPSPCASNAAGRYDEEAIGTKRRRETGEFMEQKKSGKFKSVRRRFSGGFSFPRAFVVDG